MEKRVRGVIDEERGKGGELLPMKFLDQQCFAASSTSAYLGMFSKDNE